MAHKNAVAATGGIGGLTYVQGHKLRRATYGSLERANQQSKKHEEMNDDLVLSPEEVC